MKTALPCQLTARSPMFVPDKTRVSIPSSRTSSCPGPNPGSAPGISPTIQLLQKCCLCQISFHPERFFSIQKFLDEQYPRSISDQTRHKKKIPPDLCRCESRLRFQETLCYFLRLQNKYTAPPPAPLPSALFLLCAAGVRSTQRNARCENTLSRTTHCVPTVCIPALR